MVVGMVMVAVAAVMVMVEASVTPGMMVVIEEGRGGEGEVIAEQEM